MHAFTRLKKGADKMMEWICISILSIMSVLVTYQVITRYIFNKPSAISETIAQYLFVWMVMFGSTLVFGDRGHLAITVISDKLRPLPAMIVEILSNLTLVAFSSLILVRGGWAGAMKQMATSDASLGVSMGVIYISIPICGIAMVFYAIYNICLAVHEYKEKIRPASDGDIIK